MINQTKPYCIGSDDWNGLSKLIEELGELQQVCGKLIGSEGRTDHWSGDLREKFIEEIGDVRAAVLFFCENNFSDDDLRLITERFLTKFKTFTKWDIEVRKANYNE